MTALVIGSVSAHARKPHGHTRQWLCIIDAKIDKSLVIDSYYHHQLSGLSLLGPMNSTPSIGMSFSLMAFCTHRWYFRKVSVHGSPLRSPFRNFSANQRLKHWSYSRFRSVQASPTLFISDCALEKQQGSKIWGNFFTAFQTRNKIMVSTQAPWLSLSRVIQLAGLRVPSNVAASWRIKDSVENGGTLTVIWRFGDSVFLFAAF